MRRWWIVVAAVTAVAVAAGIGLWLVKLVEAPGGGSILGSTAPPPLTPVLAAGRAGHDGPAVPASVETQLVPGVQGDVMDDAAIWRNPDDPARSLVLADVKSADGGVAVYDLTGRLVRFERVGKIGNIDLRDGVRVGDRTVTLVGANDRTRDALRLWALAPDGTLSSLEARALPTVKRNYGFCLGRSAGGDHLYAFVSVEEGGTLEQYELVTSGDRLDARKVRTLDVGSQSEGCAVDDRTGALYVGEEDVGLWRYDVDPTTGASRRAVDTAGKGRLTADVEGVTVTRGADGHGVLIASSQGDSTFAVYDVDDTSRFLGGFRVDRSGPTDGVSETDGLAVAAGDFGSSFPYGLLVVHDGENHQEGRDEPSSNLKFVRLDRVVTLR